MTSTTSNWHQFATDFPLSPTQFYAELTEIVSNEGLKMSQPKRKASGRREYLFLKSGRNSIHVGAIPIKSGTMISGWVSSSEKTGMMMGLIRLGELVGKIPIVGSAFKMLFVKLAGAAQPKETLAQMDERILFVHVVKSAISRITEAAGDSSGIRENRPAIQ